MRAQTHTPRTHAARAGTYAQTHAHTHTHAHTYHTRAQARTHTRAHTHTRERDSITRIDLDTALSLSVYGLKQPGKTTRQENGANDNRSDDAS